MYETIVWATDGSDGANAALGAALELAELSGGRVVATHCDQRLSGRAGAWPALADEDDVRARLRRQVAELADGGVDIDLVIRKSHHDAPEVVSAVAAELDADVIVCGTRGLGTLSGALLGSFAHGLLHVAPCPVLAVREEAARVSPTTPERDEVAA